MFDGHNVFFDEDATFGKSWGMKEYLDNHPRDLIVVGIECNDEGWRRLNEYSPVDFSYEGMDAAEAVKMLLQRSKKAESEDAGW